MTEKKQNQMKEKREEMCARDVNDIFMMMVM
jgi:hypothetical protein